MSLLQLLGYTTLFRPEQNENKHKHEQHDKWKSNLLLLFASACHLVTPAKDHAPHVGPCGLLFDILVLCLCLNTGRESCSETTVETSQMTDVLLTLFDLESVPRLKTIKTG